MTLAGDAVHNGNYVVCGSCLCLCDISVSKQGDGALIATDNPVYQELASCILHQRDSPSLDVGIFPWSECDLIAQMYHERVHAVAFHGDSHSLAFGNQLPDFLHHHSIIFYDSLRHIFCKNKDKIFYLWKIYEKII